MIVKSVQLLLCRGDTVNILFLPKSFDMVPFSETTLARSSSLCLMMIHLSFTVSKDFHWPELNFKQIGSAQLYEKYAGNVYVWFWNRGQSLGSKIWFWVFLLCLSYFKQSSVHLVGYCVCVCVCVNSLFWKEDPRLLSLLGLFMQNKK